MKINKPGLLDAVADRSNLCEINGKWYIAKPLPYCSWLMIFERLYHCWLVFTNKATAIQYAQDKK